MKKYFYGLMVALITITAFSFVSCDDDDDNGSKAAGGTQRLTVNGETWVSHAEEEPRYNGDLGGDTWVNSTLVFCSFIRNDNPFAFFSSYVSFDIYLDGSKGQGITKGMDIATSPYVYWGGGNNEYELSVGIPEGDGYIHAMYGDDEGVMSGSAIIQDFEYHNFLTIKFSNFKLPNTYYVRQTGDIPETLTLDGTVTFKYTDSLLDIY